jgi:hypothetical protein
MSQAHETKEPIMNKTTFETPELDELRDRHDTYWTGALYGVTEVAVMDGDEDPAAAAISARMPYHAAFTAYLGHVGRCPQCGEGQFMDQCPEGDRLSDISAKAMCAQATSGDLN